MNPKNCYGCEYVEMVEEEHMVLTTCLKANMSRTNPSRHKNVLVLSQCPKDKLNGCRRDL